MYPGYAGYYPPYPGVAGYAPAPKGKPASSAPSSKVNFPLPKFGKKKKASKDGLGAAMEATSGMKHSQTDHGECSVRVGVSLQVLGWVCHCRCEGGCVTASMRVGVSLQV